MRDFSIPTRLISGADSIKALDQLQSQRVWIVCDNFLAKSMALQSIIIRLQVTNQVALFTEVTPDPTTADVAKGIAAMVEFAPDTVIAYGGGSAIDLTKAILYIAHQQGVNNGMFIAIPTTSGTGSEVTKVSVITVVERQIKVPIVDDKLLPDMAILDPNQTLTVPPAVTANTGIDTLTHAIEAMASTNNDDFSNALAEKAISLVFKYLHAAFCDGSDIEARQKLLNASCLAGLAFNHAGLGLTHAIAHQFGTSLHIPHGLANALLLTEVMTFNRQCQQTEATYAKLARCLGFVARDTNRKSGAEAFIRETQLLIESLGITEASVRLSLVPKSDEQLLAVMASNTLQDITLQTNPVQPNLAQVAEIIRAI